MRVIALVVSGFLLVPAASLTTATHAAAEVICQTYVYRVGARTCLRRVCWHTQPQRYYAQRAWQWENAAPPRDDDEVPGRYSGTSRGNQDWTYSGTYTEPIPKPVFKLPSLPRIPKEPIFIFVMVAGGILIARLIDWAKAVWQQRRLGRIHRQTQSARAVNDRLCADAREADALIRAFSREAYRFGRSF